jgi:hypothetical protein
MKRTEAFSNAQKFKLQICKKQFAKRKMPQTFSLTKRSSAPFFILRSGKKGGENEIHSRKENVRVAVPRMRMGEDRRLLRRSIKRPFGPWPSCVSKMPEMR